MKHLHRAAGLTAAWAACCAAATAATPAAPPPPDIFFKPATWQEVLLSPSGKRLAVNTPGANGRLGVFVIDLQGSEFKATRAVLFTDGDVPDFEWVDDERLVFSSVDLRAGLGEDSRRAPGL